MISEIGYPTIDIKNTVNGRYFNSEEIILAKREKDPLMLNVSMYLTKKCNIDCIDCYTKAIHENLSSKADELLGERLLLEEHCHIIDECAKL